MQEHFTVEGPGLTSIRVTLGENAEEFRGSLMAPGWVVPSHLVALSKELAQVHLSDDDDYGRAILCEGGPVFAPVSFEREARFACGPAVGRLFDGRIEAAPEHSGLLGIGCRPIAVYGGRRRVS